jgi:hypothetical protein
MEMQENTEAQKRTDDFLKAYNELVKKYRIDFGHQLLYVKDGTGGYKTVIQVSPVDLDSLPSTRMDRKEP